MMNFCRENALKPACHLLIIFLITCIAPWIALRSVVMADTLRLKDGTVVVGQRGKETEEGVYFTTIPRGDITEEDQELGSQLITVFYYWDEVIEERLPAAPARGKIVGIEGEAEIRKKGQSDWLSAADSMFVDEGDAVRAARGSSLAMELSNKAIVDCPSGTRLEIRTLSENPDTHALEVVLYTAAGTMWCEVGKLEPPGTTFTVETPVATVHVLGTIFMVSVDANTRATTVAAVKGRVEVTGKGNSQDAPQSTTLKPKTIAEVNDQGLLSELSETSLKTLLPSVLADWQSRLPRIRSASRLGGIGDFDHPDDITPPWVIKAQRRELLAKAKEGKEQAVLDFREIRKGLIFFYVDIDRLPTPAEGLRALVEDLGIQAWSGPYIGRDVNIVDLLGTPYGYQIKASGRTGKTIRLIYCGADKRKGTRDDYVELIDTREIEKYGVHRIQF